MAFRWVGLSGRGTRAIWSVMTAIATAWLVALPQLAWAVEPGYIRDVQPLMRKYCGGCHNEVDNSGDFSVASYDKLLKGTPDAAVIVPGDADGSRLLQLMTGIDEPQMPPEKEAQPTEAEIGVIKAWIAAGAKNDASSVPLSEQLSAPMLAADPRGEAYTTALIDVSDSLVAVARYGRCDLRNRDGDEIVLSIGDLPGKINQLRMSPDRKFLLISGGIAGVGGLVTIVDVDARKVVGQVQGHSDTVYCAAMSPDAQWVVTGSYDRNVLLWDWREQKIVRRFAGHNGAIYDVDIDPEGKVLATASADQTVKLWGLRDGTRLDTLGQPEGEMLCVRFTPDGRRVVASGADRQLRMWELVSKEGPAINPLRVSRFAHEEPVTQIVFRGQDQLISLSEDRTVKLWQVEELRPLGLVAKCSDVPTGVGNIRADSDKVFVVDYAGNMLSADLPSAAQPTAGAATPDAAESLPAALPTAQPTAAPQAEPSSPIPEIAAAEAEPNDDVAQANVVALPAKISGVIGPERNGTPDADLFAIDAEAGRPWVIEVNAARSQSPLDSMVDVLDDQGEVVLRTRLQAVRESYFTFRGKDSGTSDDFRMHKWQEMELNEYLYAGGEVVKLWLYPRGPDSGFKVYPGYGERVTYFDTTPTAHALGAMAYIVRQLAPDEQPLPNGLPLFPIYYQNDDDSLRRWGKDSRLTFVAPKGGRYFVRVRDARSFGGEEFKYQLTVRTPRPDFELAVTGLEMTMPRGSGREWQVTAKRLDGLEAPIEIRLENIPEGFVATNPLVIEAGQDIAYGNVYATDAAKLPEGQDKVSIKLTAVSATEAGEVTHQLEQALTVTLKDEPEVKLKLVEAENPQSELEELVIRPGETISARVVIDRQGQTGPVLVGRDDAGRNLPHGSFVDNIGLNGLLITEDANEREFFITAAPWLEPQVREFHLRSDSKNNPTSRSIRLRVVPK